MFAKPKFSVSVPKLADPSAENKPILGRMITMSAEVLVVASKVKTFIKEKGACNTSAETIEAISKVVEELLTKAINNAKSDGRKTVMARDVSENAS